MFGSLLGNIAGVAYFLIFQILGVLLALLILHREKLCFTILLGSVIGSFSLQWLPALYAFFLDFSVRGHILALLTMCVIVIAARYAAGKRTFLNGRKITFRIRDILSEHPVLFLLLPLFVLLVLMLLHHTLSYSGGAMHSGQSTYGDMNMHLGFITSIARQKTFPPEYSILPGTRLAYPFLSDSISSSIYLWGASLRIAYLLPMFFALLQVFFGMYTLARFLLEKFGGSARGKSFLAFVLFFFNGGFGFFYFINEGFASENFTRIFTAFYETPTNYVTENIQWHNVICDMLIPQRATLFGWAILFPLLALLFKAISEKKKEYFIISGVLAGGLPLIHTHSFLALGILCAGFLVLDLRLAGRSTAEPEDKRLPLPVRIGLVLAFLLLMSLISWIQLSDEPWEPNRILTIGLFLIIAFIGALFYNLKKGFNKNILYTWGVFLGIVLLCALPQLFGFTFRQVQGENFVRGSFDWANTTDPYLWFCLKNYGILFILTMLMFIFGSRRQVRLALPAAFLWLISEFILFQPNSYDNNKLLLVAYLFFCISLSDFIWETIPRLCGKFVIPIRIATVSAVTVLAAAAAVLTIGREIVSDYEVYDSSYLSLCQWIEDSTSPKDVFLTATNHNNAVASLTGRNIVCGSGTFLFYHGINYTQNEADVKTMYENPDMRDKLLAAHNVDYIVVGRYEQADYAIPDLQEMAEKYELVYNRNGIAVFEV